MWDYFVGHVSVRCHCSYHVACIPVSVHVRATGCLISGVVSEPCLLGGRAWASCASRRNVWVCISSAFGAWKWRRGEKLAFPCKIKPELSLPFSLSPSLFFFFLSHVRSNWAPLSLLEKKRIRYQKLNKGELITFFWKDFPSKKKEKKNRKLRTLALQIFQYIVSKFDKKPTSF